MDQINNNSLINLSQSLISLEQFENKFCCRERNVQAKPNRANLIIVTPVMSAPIYQPRKWTPKSSRPLPDSEEEFDNFMFKNTQSVRGLSVDNSNYIQINPDIDPNCFWRYSRVFGKSKKVLKSLNPIKHWRNQLIPRQLYYLDHFRFLNIFLQ